jgi:endonuclease/exonuclease/phosphatase family metal-dependent hydrolase
MSRRELYSYRWDGIQWVTVTNSLHSEFASKSFNTVATNLQNTKPIVDNTIRVATFNILADCFPWFIEMAIRSAERFEWLVNSITILNPTIIGLNEVTTNALQQLQQCPFIRENYFITEMFDEKTNDDSSKLKSVTNGLLAPHGCVILSKLPLLEVFAISVTGSAREAVVGKVQLDNDSESCVYFCAHHTTAYQTPKKAQLRARQIRDIVNVLQPLGLPFVIMGDLNLHYEFEDAVVVDNGLIDAWAQTHFSRIHPFNDANAGYTFDAVKNTLIPYYIPGERRQMRLDRILFSRGFPAFAITPCAMWANEPIKSDNYLFPSDHFGLFIDLIYSHTDSNRQTDITMMPIDKPDPSAEQILSRNAQNNKGQRAYRLGLLQTTMALAYHVVWLGAVALGLK